MNRGSDAVWGKIFVPSFHGGEKVITPEPSPSSCSAMKYKLQVLDRAIIADAYASHVEKLDVAMPPSGALSLVKEQARSLQAVQRILFNHWAQTRTINLIFSGTYIIIHCLWAIACW